MDPIAVCDSLTCCEPVEAGAVRAGPEGQGYGVRVHGALVLAWSPLRGWQALAVAVERAGVVIMAVGLLHARGTRVAVVQRIAGL